MTFKIGRLILADDFGEETPIFAISWGKVHETITVTVIWDPDSFDWGFGTMALDSETVTTILDPEEWL